MVFHGFGGSAGEFMMDADLRSLAERDSFLLVYPHREAVLKAIPIGIRVLQEAIIKVLQKTSTL